jgi:GNAT superfamily N-acetyltransferase
MTITCHVSTLTVEQKEAVWSLARIIFPSLDRQKFEERLARPGCVVLLCSAASELIGFKIGYRESETIFYSWLGGVLENFRGRGIGQQLMDRQHDHCRQNGYGLVKTKTMNQWRHMLMLNLKNGFEITETYPGKNGALKIVLTKSLF